MPEPGLWHEKILHKRSAEAFFGTKARRKAFDKIIIFFVLFEITKLFYALVHKSNLLK